MNSDRWRLITVCPVCLDHCHLHYDAAANDRNTPRVPHATYPEHDDTAGNRCPMSGREAVPWDERSTRVAVAGRSQGVCEYCQQRPADQMHHRISRGAGGGWYPSNILHLCQLCHNRAGYTVAEYVSGPAWAQSVGLSVRASSGDDPALVPLLREDGTTIQPSDDVAPPLPTNGQAPRPARKKKRGTSAKDADRRRASRWR